MLVRRIWPSLLRSARVIPLAKPCKDYTKGDGYRDIQCILDNRLGRATRFNPFQRGYVAGGSCIEAAFFLYVVIQKAIIRHSVLYAIFVDLSIAFPSAPRALIYIKSMLKGIPAVLVRLVMAIYRDTDAWAGQYTRIFPENRGSGEGSVLGPTLFLILYDDIVEF